MRAHIARLQQRLFELQEKVKDEEARNSKVLSTIASISWWLTHAMPWVRGSAAINAMYIEQFAGFFEP